MLQIGGECNPRCVLSYCFSPQGAGNTLTRSGSYDQGEGMKDTILIVDDELSVRQTFMEWLQRDLPEAEVLVAADAEGALTTANERQIDLAILDWNLGAGSHGLQLLEDLHIFQPDLVAILVTGYADKATPLSALRLGVRDYFDKNQQLTRDKLVAAVRLQLEKLRPLKRERQIQRQLLAFRSAVETALPMVESVAALRDSVPLSEVVRALFVALRQQIQATTGLLVLHAYQESKQPHELVLTLTHEGNALPRSDRAYGNSLAATVAFQQPHAIRTDLARLRNQPGLQLSPIEAKHHFVLCQTITLGPATTVTIELFDKIQEGAVIPFDPSDQTFLHSIMPLAAICLKRTFQEQETHVLLQEALNQALQVSKQFDHSLKSIPVEDMMRSVQPGLSTSLVSIIPGPELKQLATRLDRLAEKHGLPAIRYCTQLLAETEELLDAATGLGAK